MTTSRYAALSGRYVQFRIRDVHLPNPGVILDELYSAEVLEGKVVDISTDEAQGGAFVVIQVEDLHRPLVLAVERILRVL